MSLGAPIREKKPEPDEWVHEPTPTAPHLYRNRRTGMLKNEAPIPAPKYTNLPYMGKPTDPKPTDIACRDPEFNPRFELL